MGYQKFSERPQGGHKTLGGFDGLGGHHHQIPNDAKVSSELEIRTPTPPKVAKPPKVRPGIGTKPETLGALGALGAHHVPFAEGLDALDRQCPAYVEPDRWRQCIDDAQRFIADWGDKAKALSTNHRHSHIRATAGCPVMTALD